MASPDRMFKRTGDMAFGQQAMVEAVIDMIVACYKQDVADGSFMTAVGEHLATILSKEQYPNLEAAEITMAKVADALANMPEPDWSALAVHFELRGGRLALKNNTQEGGELSFQTAESLFLTGLSQNWRVTPMIRLMAFLCAKTLGECLFDHRLEGEGGGMSVGTSRAKSQVMTDKQQRGL